jgi:low affinity Fe/Cu permease
MNNFFRRIAHKATEYCGSPLAFVIALSVIIVWLITGPLFHFSDTWQLVINTGTTIITFLMVFLIQNAQNRDGKSIQLKLDEVIRSIKTARNEIIDLENCTDEELHQLEQEFRSIHLKTQAKIQAKTQAKIQAKIQAKTQNKDQAKLEGSEKK